MRKILNPTLVNSRVNKRSPIFKTAAVYGAFLGTSANLRYQVIAGIVEHRISDQFSDQTFFINMLSFIVRTVNSYWGTKQWIEFFFKTVWLTTVIYLHQFSYPTFKTFFSRHRFNSFSKWKVTPTTSQYRE